MSTITPEKVRDYIDHLGVLCLHCRSDDLITGLPYTLDADVRMECRCGACDARWVDVLRLAAVEADDEDDVEGDDVLVEPTPAAQSTIAREVLERLLERHEASGVSLRGALMAELVALRS